MTKPNKNRKGLQRKVSSVFKGVVIPGGERTPNGESSPVPAGEQDVVSQNANPVAPISDSEADNKPYIPSEQDTIHSPMVEQSATIEKPVENVEQKVTADSAPPVSTNQQNPQSSLIKTLGQTEETENTIRPPSASVESEDAQVPTIKHAVPDKPKNPVKQVPTNKPAPQSSIMKKLAQSEELEDAVVSPLSASEEPEVVQQGPAVKQAHADKPLDPEQQVQADKQAPQSSLMTQLAQSEESDNNAVADQTADTQLPISSKWETPLNHKLKKDRTPELSTVAGAKNKNILKDSFVDDNVGRGFLEQIKEKFLPSNEGGGSTKDKVMMLLVPVLAIVMIVTFRQVLSKSPDKAGAAGKKSDTAAVAVESSNEIEWKIPEPLPAMTRDPLVLPESEDTKIQNRNTGENPGQNSDTTTAQTTTDILNVRDIVYSDEKASALINGRIVHVGSVINGVTVVKINRDSVEFERNGETWVQNIRD